MKHAMLAALALGCSSSVAAAQGLTDGIHLKLLGGASLLFSDEVARSAGPRSDVDFTPGFAAGAALAYELTPNISLEFEDLYRSADMDKASAAGFGDGGDFAAVIVTINPLYQFDAWQGPVGSRVRPFVGAGVGVTQEIDFDIQGGGDSRRIQRQPGPRLPASRRCELGAQRELGPDRGSPVLRCRNAGPADGPRIPNALIRVQWRRGAARACLSVPGSVNGPCTDWAVASGGRPYDAPVQLRHAEVLMRRQWPPRPRRAGPSTSFAASRRTRACASRWARRTRRPGHPCCPPSLPAKPVPAGRAASRADPGFGRVAQKPWHG